MSRGLADTSIFIAREQARPLDALPDELAVSVVTIGELELGLLAATDDDTRSRRATTLDYARRADPIPVTEAVMSTFARIVHDCRVSGRRPKAFDALIAATAVQHGLPVVTQDSDFDGIAEAHPALQVRRV